MKNKFKVALVQMASGPDKADNLTKAARLISRAASLRADVACLPELFNYMGDMKSPKAAETTQGISLMLMRDLAQSLGIYIVAGSMLIRKKGSLPRNTCFLISPRGEVFSSYSKMHLFDARIPKKLVFEESKYMSAGTKPCVVKTPLGIFGFAICNDLRYPELFRKMILAGAEVIFVPSAFTRFTGRSHWLSLTKVRAIENQCYVVAVNQCGKNFDGVEFFGESVAFDPWGDELASAEGQKENVVVCDVDLAKARLLRKHLPALKKIKIFNIR